jgi:predicted O-linked N-acetylglucosamine transferase (SPINDLY family)
LAVNPNKLGNLRRKLLENRDRCALFDTPRFVRNLERAFEEMRKP